MSIPGEYQRATGEDGGQDWDIDAEFAEMQQELDLNDEEAASDLRRSFEQIHERVYDAFETSGLPRVIDRDDERQNGLCQKYLDQECQRLCEKQMYSPAGLTPEKERLIAIESYRHYIEQSEAETQLIFHAVQILQDEQDANGNAGREKVINRMKMVAHARLDVLHGMDKQWLDFFDRLVGLEPTFDRPSVSDYAAVVMDDELEEFKLARQLRWSVVDEAVKMAGVDCIDDDLETVIVTVEFATLLAYRAMVRVSDEDELQQAERNADMWDFARRVGPAVGIDHETQKRIISYYEAMYPPESAPK